MIRLALLLVLILPANSLPPPVHPFAPQGVVVYPSADAFVAVNNQLRKERDLGPMLYSEALAVEAHAWAHVCVSQGFIRHEDRLKERLATRGFDAVVCEDILCGGPPMLGRDPFALWKSSNVRHHKVILGDYTHCGFAVAYDKRGYGYWVGIYATPRKQL